MMVAYSFLADKYYFEADKNKYSWQTKITLKELWELYHNGRHRYCGKPRRCLAPRLEGSSLRLALIALSTPSPEPCCHRVGVLCSSRHLSRARYPKSCTPHWGRWQGSLRKKKKNPGPGASLQALPGTSTAGSAIRRSWNKNLSPARRGGNTGGKS